MFPPGRCSGDFADSSLVRTDAQSRAEIESSRARDPYMARCEFSLATALRERAHTEYCMRFLGAYGSQRREPMHRIMRPERNLRYHPVMNAATSNCRLESRPCQNKSYRGSGSYGHILVRARQMYVARTPFALAEGTAHRRTLILPAGMQADDDLAEIGRIARREVGRIVVAYNFALQSNELTTTLVPNPTSGPEHAFKAYRLEGDPVGPVVHHARSRKIAGPES